MNVWQLVCGPSAGHVAVFTTAPPHANVHIGPGTEWIVKPAGTMAMEVPEVNGLKIYYHSAWVCLHRRELDALLVDLMSRPDQGYRQ